jgi:mono/diheme cytochrome c family protein
MLALGMACATFLTGCDDWMPGKPHPDEKWVPQSEITDFHHLYSQNCAACHSDDPKGISPSRPMNDPVFLALIDDATLTQVIANGVPNTAMPPFAIDQGGPLTDAQIQALVKGLRAWAKPWEYANEKLPPYSAPLGDPIRGQHAFSVYCASCHGGDGKGIPGDDPQQAGNVVDPNYLGLVSDQSLRTTIICGRHDLGMPDYRAYVQGKPMSDQEISDVVAWLASHRLRIWQGQAGAAAPAATSPAPPARGDSSPPASTPAHP